MTPRRFPPPWSFEDIDAAFVVKAGERAEASVFVRDEIGGGIW